MDLFDAINVLENNKDIVFVTVFSDELEVPFTLPSVNEARRYSVLLSMVKDSAQRSRIYSAIFEKYCCDKTLFDEETFSLPAGIGETVAKLMLWLSGHGEEPIEYLESLLAQNRTKTDLFDLNFMKRTICQVFHAYTFKDLDEMNFVDLVEIFVQAEKVLIEVGFIKEEFKMATKSKEKANQVDIDALIEEQAKGLSSVDGPPRMPRLQPGERPSDAMKRARMGR
jgi:hypothetical protein